MLKKQSVHLNPYIIGSGVYGQIIVCICPDICPTVVMRRR